MTIIGRDAALAALRQRLDRSRLVTITGPGGIGKTTVADALLASEAHRYPMGVSRVDLTRVDEPTDVEAALATQLGFGSFRALLDSPTDDPALVVVDNCEHVLDAAAGAIAALLDACRSPTVVATSRSPLGLSGESVVVLGPLELPPVGLPDPTAAAVQLFLQRAADAGATVDDGELDAIARLCHMLDGLPLAIELAAARTRVLTPSELLERLDHLDTLSRPRGRGPVRHRSIRDTIEWSYALLDPADQRFFDRLSVLVGPFTASDAHAVAGEGDELTTLDRLDRLTTDSLLTAEAIAGVTHHRQLELVRGFARERLIASGAWDATWQRFVDRVTERSTRLALDTSRGWDRTALATLLSRVDHHLSVLRWCVEHDDHPSRSFMLVATLWGVVHQGRHDDVAAVSERALARWPAPALPGWADAAATVGTCRYLAGDPLGAIELAHKALDHADQTPYAPCTLRRLIGHASCAVGDVRGAVAALSEAIEIASGRVPALEMEMRASRAELAANLHDGNDAISVVERSLAAARDVAATAESSGAVVNEIWARSVEASLLGRIDPGSAQVAAERALAASRTALYPACESVNLHTLATLAVDRGDLAAAAKVVRELIDGLVARGASTELRNAFRLAAVVLERVGDARWSPLAATATAMPVVSLFSLPGHERHSLPAATKAPLRTRDAVILARTALDVVIAANRVPDGPTDPGPRRHVAHDGEVHATPSHDGAPNRLQPQGEVWVAEYDGSTVHLRTSKGLADIARLLAAPNSDVHCLDLVGAVVEEHATGEVIDARARREYEERVRELQAEIDDADAAADYHRADRARAELDAIVDHLTTALGLRGRTRRHNDTTERARSTVTQRIRSTIRKIEADHPALGAHLRASIQTGVYCRYQPERSMSWLVDPVADGTPAREA